MNTRAPSIGSTLREHESNNNKYRATCRHEVMHKASRMFNISPEKDPKGCGPSISINRGP